MFWTVLGEVLTPGFGAALSPMMIVAAVLLATSPGGARRSFTYALGDFLALAILGLVVLFVSHGTNVGVESGPSKVGTAIRLVLGVAFLVFAWSTFKHRPKKGAQPELPKWMSTMDTMSTGRVLLVGLSMGFLNAKNLPLAIAVATSVAQTGAGTTVSVIGIMVFAALGSLGVLAPGLVRQFIPKDAERVLNATREFFIEHNAVIMTVLFLILGVNAIGKSLGPLFN
jgi:threonine/homoserine/homoserine lactone efflux protein